MFRRFLFDDVAPACEVLVGKGKLNKIFLPAGLEPNSRTCTTFCFSDPRLLSSLPCASSLHLTVVWYFFGVLVSRLFLVPKSTCNMVVLGN